MVDFWIILTGCLVALNCGLLGNFLVLRQMSMIGDAISHAVLPGIVMAYLWTSSRDTGIMLLGASLTGILATFLIEFIHRKVKLQADASIGVVFTFMFAIGIILISVFANQVDIDQECVLYGEIAYVPIDVIITKSNINLGPKAVYLQSLNLILVISFITIGYRNLKITSFDPNFAKTIGIPTQLWQYLLMAFVSFTTVNSFETVGAILVVGFIIGPPSIAYLLTDELRTMLIVTAIIGVLISITGYYLAFALNASVAGCMIVMLGFLFGITVLYTKVSKKPRKQLG